MTFANFFRAVWGHDPFPWQSRLAAEVLKGKWHPIGLPTAAGKTALIDIAVYALAMGVPGAPRRIFFVVDRRVIVDEAADRARTLAEKLRTAPEGSELRQIADSLRALNGGAEPIEPLAVGILRGGIERDDSWTESPLQPLVICSTVDQVGSSLLFQGYGKSNFQWPIRAGLAANDALVILDEAHTSQPFAETLDLVSRYRGWSKEEVGGALKVVEMSATPRSSEAFREGADDREHPELSKRWRAQKKARLAAPVEDAEFTSTLRAEAVRLAQEPSVKVVGVICNRVRTAREVFHLLERQPDSQAILLTGRARPYDRDQLWSRYQPWIAAGRAEEPEQTIFVVATQCIEVGANISFDALVTEIASMDALEQRFGRLDRLGTLGRTSSVVVARKEQAKAPLKDKVDPIYGEALNSSWKWLLTHEQTETREIVEQAPGKKKPKVTKVKEKYVDMGVLALREALAATPDRQGLVMPREHAPVLMPAHLDLLCQTSPEPAAVPEVALYLHGPRSGPADVEVVWRADLDEQAPETWASLAAICPPSPAEAIALPVWAVRKWLARDDSGDCSDVEGRSLEPQGPRPTLRPGRPVLLWRGPDESEVTDQVRPGARILVPATYGGCDQWGWNAESTAPVIDVGDAVKLRGGRPLLRLHAQLEADYPGLVSQLRACETSADAKEALRSSNAAGWVSEVIVQMRRSTPRLVRSGTGQEGNDKVVAVVGKGSFAQESRFAQYGAEVELDTHLAGVESWAARFADGLPERVRATVLAAARCHDLGKADPRFQSLLRGGNAAGLDQLLAKSSRNGNNSAAIEAARVKSGYPKGCRHELLSVALLQTDLTPFAELDRDLLLHLVGSHHGRCRPFAPVVRDADGPLVRYGDWQVSANHELARIGSGVAERFWRLTRHYGWYGLAYLETVLRLADARQSQEEQEHA